MLLRANTYTEGLEPGEIHSSITFAPGKVVSSDLDLKPEGGSGGNTLPGARGRTTVVQPVHEPRASARGSGFPERPEPWCTAEAPCRAASAEISCHAGTYRP